MLQCPSPCCHHKGGYKGPAIQHAIGPQLSGGNDNRLRCAKSGNSLTSVRAIPRGHRVQYPQLGKVAIHRCVCALRVSCRFF